MLGDISPTTDVYHETKSTPSILKRVLPYNLFECFIRYIEQASVFKDAYS